MRLASLDVIADILQFLRKKLIGKSVRAHIDFIRPQEGIYEEREHATIRLGPNQLYVVVGHRLTINLHVVSNVAEQLIEKGLATVVRHKRDDEDRSPDYDKLMAAEQL